MSTGNGTHPARFADAPPPGDPEAERQYLACLLKDSSIFIDARATRGDFVDLDFGIIYQIMQARFDAGDVLLDAGALWLALKGNPDLEHINTKSVLADLLTTPVAAGSWRQFERAIIEHSQRRKLMRELKGVLAEASNPDVDIAEIAARATEQLGAIARATGAGRTQWGAVWTRLSDVERKQVDWLWPSRIPLGKITLFFGDPGLGKSFVSLYLAARCSVGGMWPDGIGSAPLGTTIILNCEDANDDTNCPRLDAMGADTTKIISLDAIRLPGDNGKVVERPFSLADVKHLADLIEKNPDAKLVVIDPVSGFLNGTDAHKNSDVRGLLAPLAKMAEQYRIAIIIVNHMNKSGGARALYRAMDSIAFSAAARAAWIFLPDTDEDEDGADDEGAQRVLFLPAKSNLARSRGGLAYSIDQNGRVVWEHGRVDRKADDVLADAGIGKAGRPADERASAEKWLAAYLADGGEHPFATLKAAAEAAGIKYKTLQRAADRLGIVKQRAGFGGAWIWRKLRPAPTGKPDPDNSVHYGNSVQYDENGELA